MKNKETMELIEVKTSIWTKIKNWFRKLKKNNIYAENIEASNFENEANNRNEIIAKAQVAYENYVLNSDYELSKNIYELVKERIAENEDVIRRLIEINKEEISYNQIIEVLNKEEKGIQEYKKTNVMSKIDDKFMFSQYQVSVGIIGIITKNSYIAIQNIFKAISTRNSIIVIQKNYNEHSIENLILLIVQECLNKFNIDQNIIQIIDSTEINKDDLKESDIIISENGTISSKEQNDKMYIYQEDEYFSEVVKSEVKRLNLSGKNVEVIKGKIDDCIETINSNRSFGVCIYTKDRKKAYRFINLVNSENVFFNGTLLNAKKNKKISNMYLTLKNLVYEYKMI